jgi:hypothetical protein
LNAERAPSPRPQQGRPCGWTRSSVVSVLNRTAYRGEITWNKTKKRDAEGCRTCPTVRPQSEWLRLDRPDLRIVSDELWQAAHARIAAARQDYDAATHGQRRRQHHDVDSKYLLTGFCTVRPVRERSARPESRTRPTGDAKLSASIFLQLHRPL